MIDTHKTNEVARWFLAWSQHKGVILDGPRLQKMMVLALMISFEEFDTPIFKSNVYKCDGGFHVTDIFYLKEDFDFADFRKEENNLLMMAWNTIIGDKDWNFGIIETWAQPGDVISYDFIRNVTNISRDLHNSVT